MYLISSIKYRGNTIFHITISKILPARLKEDLDMGCVIYYDNIKIFRKPLQWKRNNMNCMQCTRIDDKDMTI